MRHAGDNDSEPDLTPLLDLVLQLLMFFIINANFVSEQGGADLKLPRSESARPVEKADRHAIYIGQSLVSRPFLIQRPLAEGELLRAQESVVLISTQPPMTLLQAKAWLEDRHDFLAKLNPDGKVDTVIHYRPEADLEVRLMLEFLSYCKAAGFNQIKVHARIKKAEG